METNTCDLRKRDSPFMVSTTLVIPPGRVGSADSHGRRKVVWQRDGKQIYIICPGCGKILEHDGRGLFIMKKDFYTHLCIACPSCDAHQYAFLQGAANALFRHIQRSPKICPTCRQTVTENYPCTYLRRVSPKEKQGFRTRYWYCSNCGLAWPDSKRGETPDDDAPFPL